MRQNEKRPRIYLMSHCRHQKAAYVPATSFYLCERWKSLERSYFRECMYKYVIKSTYISQLKRERYALWRDLTSFFFISCKNCCCIFMDILDIKQICKWFVIFVFKHNGMYVYLHLDAIHVARFQPFYEYLYKYRYEHLYKYKYANNEISSLINTAVLKISFFMPVAYRLRRARETNEVGY